MAALSRQSANRPEHAGDKTSRPATGADSASAIMKVPKTYHQYRHNDRGKRGNEERRVHPSPLSPDLLHAVSVAGHVRSQRVHIPIHGVETAEGLSPNTSGYFATVCVRLRNKRIVICFLATPVSSCLGKRQETL